ncbi:MAG: efflux RND transporter periplasmic adaptor subunit [Thiobacillus sp.]|uniref:efflux RND transporter periplasmic adaptor subunit n=1 Tax=Thiobacillus sp. TaxID=924 RepID=UPI002894CFE8|nr:efflux RND transporter periplasmic adaptor subunit [Thiobacillus sp.]MDT3706122.1 efflux RND transporter periplasmic adaptor subunit [Thiobacillus sp.]
MIRKYLLPLLAAVGVAIAIVAVVIDNRPVSAARPAVQAPRPPFASYVSGAGIIEASSGNIAVGTPVSGIVTAIYVKWGDHVKPGDRLFSIDDRDLQARRLLALAGVKEGAARLAQARGQLRRAESVSDRRAISVEEMDNRRSAVAISEAALASAQAQVRQIRLEIDRRTVRALEPGQILQISIRPGEFAASGDLAATPLMLLGSDTRLYLRVDIDENDAWRVKPGAEAMAFVRGNPDLRTPLRFERIDPYVVPKTALTGNSTERVDTRVLQVVYSFDPAALPAAYIGQQMGVFIQTASGTAPPRPAAGPP